MLISFITIIPNTFSETKSVYKINNMEILFSRESTEVEAAVSIFSWYFLPQLQFFILIVQTRENRKDYISFFPCIYFNNVLFTHIFIQSFVFVPAEHCQWCSPWVLWGHRHPECSKQTIATHINTPPDFIMWLIIKCVEKYIYIFFIIKKLKSKQRQYIYSINTSAWLTAVNIS